MEAARQARATGDVASALVAASAAVNAAQSEHDAETAYDACLSMGRMYIARGEAPEAAYWHRTALEEAMDHGLTQCLPVVYHEYGLALREAGNYKRFRELLAVAFELYKARNSRDRCVAGVIADLAQGDSEQAPSDRDLAAYAMQTWRSVVVTMRTPLYLFNSASNQMRAASILRTRTRYETASEDLDRFFARLPDHEGAAITLAWASAAALTMQDYPRALELAEKAESIATERGEGIVIGQARELRDSALAERAVRA